MTQLVGQDEAGTRPFGAHDQPAAATVPPQTPVNTADLATTAQIDQLFDEEHVDQSPAPGVAFESIAIVCAVDAGETIRQQPHLRDAKGDAQAFEMPLRRGELPLNARERIFRPALFLNQMQTKSQADRRRLRAGRCQPHDRFLEGRLRMRLGRAQSQNRHQE